METATVTTAEPATGSTTIADLLPLAVEQYGAEPAIMLQGRLRASGSSKSFDEVGDTVKRLSLGLIDARDLRRATRSRSSPTPAPEWTYFDFAALTAGATVVPIYQTNSPEECQYVLENSDAKAVIVEDDEQLEKIRQVRDRCPKLEHVIRMTGSSDDAISIDELIERGAGRADSEWEERWRSVTPADICTFIYTSGTTGPPKGCVISHGNYRAMLDMALEQSVLEPGRITYLYLPLAHSFALLIQLLSFDVGGDARLLGARPAEDPPQPRRGQAALLPLGAADLREDLHGRDLEGGEGGRRPEADLQTGRSASGAEGPRARAPGQRARASRCASSTRSPTGWCSSTSATCSAGESSRRSPAPPRSTPRSCASSTPPACSCSRAGG